MKNLLIIGIMAAALALPGLAFAQDPPADYGELAELMVETWEVPAAADPGDGDANIAALDEIGIGAGVVLSSFGLSANDVPAEIATRFTSAQELTNDFLCQLHILTWAAGEVGNIDFFGVGGGTAAVQSLIELHQRQTSCAPGPPDEEPVAPVSPPSPTTPTS